MAIALYLRLSESDGDLGVDGKNESNSIENQRLLLNQYIKAQKWEDEVLEYVDDGYSGTNFNRPSFKRMIEDAKTGQISTIIVKDLSRLGRDYITAGDYIEQIFPLLKIRFIAINNGFDSDNQGNSNMSFDMAVSNLINTFYSRDLSKKIRSANTARWKRGINTSGRAPFGYKKDPVHKGKFVIDQPAAEIVRKIFSLAMEGRTTSQIAYVLNEEKIPVPSVYNKQNNILTNESFPTAEHEMLWDINKVCVILKRYEYTGALVMGKRTGVSLGSRRRKNQPFENCIVVENTHEAIVTKEEFEEANMVIKRKREPDFKIQSSFPLKSKLRCGNCRLMMRYEANTGTDIVNCEHGLKIGKHSSCFKGNYSMKRIEGVVLYSLLQMLDTMQWLGDKGEKTTRKKVETGKAKAHDISKEIDALKQEKIRQYTRFADELITREAYIKIKNELTAKIEELQLKLKTQETEVMAQDKLREAAVEMTDLSGKYAGAKKLTREMVETFIDRVYLYDPENIEIVFLFEDSIQKLMEEIQVKEEL